MPVDAGFRELVARIGDFHITDRAMKRAQQTTEAAIRGGTDDDRTRLAYLDVARRYFQAFDSEARTHLHDVDRRLEHVNQVHFNLTAERGVAVKRIEATQAVLNAVAALTEALP
jgi:hypothetical protein